VLASARCTVGQQTGACFFQLSALKLAAESAGAGADFGAGAAAAGASSISVSRAMVVRDKQSSSIYV